MQSRINDINAQEMSKMVRGFLLRPNIFAVQESLDTKLDELESTDLRDIYPAKSSGQRLLSRDEAGRKFRELKADNTIQPSDHGP